MGMGGKYFDTLEKTFGKGAVTSGARTREEQRALVRRGATASERTTHVEGDYPDVYGYDLAPGINEQIARRKLAEQGLEVIRWLPESGKGKNQGTGAHTHIEVRPLGSKGVGSRGAGGNMAGAPASNRTGQPGTGVVDPNAYLDGLASKLAPESKASQNVSTSADAIFGSDAELKKRAATAEQALVKQGEGLDVLAQTAEALHQQQIATTTQQVNESRALSQQITAGTDALKQQVMPVFEARGRIVNQLDKLITMNPLERGIRGIFDSNYDTDYLEGQLNAFDRTLKARSDDYDYLNTLHNVALKEVERRAGLDLALPQLKYDQATQDLQLLGMKVGQSSAMLGSLRDQISTESQLIAAKASAREDIINRLDGPTVLDLANQAKAAGGVVTFKGVELSYHELRMRLENDEQHDLAMEATRSAIANGRLDAAEKYANQVVRTMTRDQVNEAIKNNGQYNGIQLPIDSLVQAQQNWAASSEMRAAEVAKNLPANQALTIASESLNRMVGIHNRTTGMFGPNGLPEVVSYMSQGTDLTNRLIEATKNGEPPEVIQALTQQIAALNDATDKAVEKGILLKVGGDKRAAGYMKSFVYGVPMASGTAAEAVTYFALKGNLPEGMQLSPEAKQMFSLAQSEVGNLRGQTNPATGKQWTEADLQRKVTASLTEKATTLVGAARGDRLLNDLPLLAKQVGKTFGKMDITTWRQAKNGAATDAAVAIAKQLGIAPQQVLTMATTMKPLDGTPESKQLFDKFAQQSGNFNALENTSLIQRLDSLPQIQPGRRNSSLMLDFLHGPEINQFVGRYTGALGGTSMGDYLTNPLAQGATEQYLGKWGGEVASQRDINEADAKGNAQRQAAAYAFNPTLRMTNILSQIPGLGKDGANALMPIIVPALDEFRKTHGGLYAGANRGDTLGSGTGALVQAENEAVKAALIATRFPNDKRMETYRNIAATSWDEYTKSHDGWLDGMLNSLWGE